MNNLLFPTIECAGIGLPEIPLSAIDKLLKCDWSFCFKLKSLDVVLIKPCLGSLADCALLTTEAAYEPAVLAVVESALRFLLLYPFCVLGSSIISPSTLLRVNG